MHNVSMNLNTEKCHNRLNYKHTHTVTHKGFQNGKNKLNEPKKEKNIDFL